jgi:hypothetical protein
MNTTKPCRWFHFSLRTLFVVVTMACVWLGMQVKWIRDRQRAIDTVSGWSLGARAPWSIRLLGEQGVDRIVLDPQTAKKRERVQQLRHLFPEAKLLIIVGDFVAVISE